MYRFALSPIGDMHIENLRVVLFNFICTVKENMGLDICIEDMEKQGYEDKKAIETLEILKKFNIKHNPPTYRSSNLKFYRQFAVKLLSEKRAFSCFCTKEELDKKRELAKKEGRAYRYDGVCKRLKDIEVLDNESPFVIRLKKPTQPVSFTDTLQGNLKFELDDFVILDYNKYPTYDFACAIDDMISDTSHIICKQECILSASKQTLIYKYLGYEKTIKYTHLPDILNSKNQKISKSDKVSSVMWLLNEGFLPEAITNYLIALGNEAPKYIFTLKEAMKWFDLDKISKSSVKFDIKELKKINKEHIKLLDELQLAALLGYSSKDVGKLAKLYTKEGSTIKELKQKIDTIFSKREFPKELKSECENVAAVLKNAPKIDDFDEFVVYLREKTALKDRSFFHALSFVLTGSFCTFELKDIYLILKNLMKEIQI